MAMMGDHLQLVKRSKAVMAQRQSCGAVSEWEAWERP